MTHRLRIGSRAAYKEIRSGAALYDIREDRGFRAGDLVRYLAPRSGEPLKGLYIITSVRTGGGLLPGWCVLGLREIGA